MSIKIKTEKIMVKGKERVRVLEVEALPKKDLPYQYLSQAPNCYGSDWLYSTRIIYQDGVNTPNEEYYIELLKRGYDYDPEEFNRRLAFIRKCGDRLKRINREIKARAEKWHGEETFII
jgi:hypothetical protein